MVKDILLEAVDDLAVPLDLASSVLASVWPASELDEDAATAEVAAGDEGDVVGVAEVVVDDDAGLAHGGEVDADDVPVGGGEVGGVPQGLLSVPPDELVLDADFLGDLLEEDGDAGDEEEVDGWSVGDCGGEGRRDRASSGSS